jgi:proteasome lid subunit RPN8/RPN11
MRTHALETLPEECCGLLLAGGGRVVEAQRCRNDMTMLHQHEPHHYTRDGRTAFHMNEADCLRIQKYADEAGLEVVGVYHSHVDAGAYFSALDQQFASRELFPFPDAAHFVLSVVEQSVREVAMFTHAPDGERFEGRTVRFEGRTVRVEAP